MHSVCNRARGSEAAKRIAEEYWSDRILVTVGAASDSHVAGYSEVPLSGQSYVARSRCKESRQGKRVAAPLKKTSIFDQACTSSVLCSVLCSVQPELSVTTVEQSPSLTLVCGTCTE